MWVWRWRRAAGQKTPSETICAETTDVTEFTSKLKDMISWIVWTHTHKAAHVSWEEFNKLDGRRGCRKTESSASRFHVYITGEKNGYHQVFFWFILFLLCCWCSRQSDTMCWMLGEAYSTDTERCSLSPARRPITTPQNLWIAETNETQSYRQKPLLKPCFPTQTLTVIGLCQSWPSVSWDPG